MSVHPHTCPKCHYNKFKTISKRNAKFQCRRCGHRCDDLGHDLIENIEEAVKITTDEGSIPMTLEKTNNTVLV